MKKLLYSLLLILSMAGYSYSDTVVDGLGGGVEEGSDVGFGNITATSITVGQGSIASPSVAIGDGDTGLREPSDDILDIILGGVKKYTFDGNYMLTSTTTGSATMLSSAGTVTNTTFGFYGDPNTGITRTGVDQLSLSAGGEVFRLMSTYSEFYPSGTGQVRIYDNGDITTDGSINAAIKTYANLSNTADQTFAGTGTGYALLFNSNDNLVGITHSTSSNTENITIVTSGVYSINAQPQVTAGAAGDFHMWLQVNTGGGFADVANSNVKLSLPINNEGVIPLTLTIPLDAGDIVRLMGSVTHTSVILDATAPGGEPVIPAIICSMHKI